MGNQCSQRRHQHFSEEKASATPDTTVVAGGGTTDRGAALLQQGGKLRAPGDFRVFVEYSTEGGVPPECPAGGFLAEDGWHILHGGFRTDSQISTKDSLSAQGDLYTGREGISTLLPISFIPSYPDATLAKVNFSGSFFEGSWNHRYSGRSDTTLLISYQRYAATNVLEETRDAFDIDFQHNLSVGERHQFVWGFDYRHSDCKRNQLSPSR